MTLSVGTIRLWGGPSPGGRVETVAVCRCLILNSKILNITKQSHHVCVNYDGQPTFITVIRLSMNVISYNFIYIS